MISIPVYQPPQKVVLDPGKSLPDPYFGLKPEDLEQEYMRCAMQLIDTLDHCPHMPEAIRNNDAAIYATEMERIDRRIERYRHDCRLKYRWPDRSKYESLAEVAQEMKFRYPLERFVLDQLPVSAIRRTGDTWTGHCPIPTHEDSTPSFRVYDSIRFHCYGCEKRGDVFDLIGLVYGIESFADRLEFLAEVMS